MSDNLRKVTLTFSESEESIRYSEAVKEIAREYIKHEDAIKSYNNYRNRVDEIKSDLFSFCAERGVEIEDNVESAAIEYAPTIKDSIEPESDTQRLNAKDKYRILKDVLESRSNLEHLHEQKDGAVSFVAIKKAFMAKVEEEFGKPTNIQSPLYFEVKCYADEKLDLINKKNDCRAITLEKDGGGTGRKMCLLDVKKVLKRMEQPLKK